MNDAHKDCLELLKIVHGICEVKNIIYTIAADTLIAYEKSVEFEQNLPVIYIACLYPEFSKLRKSLIDFCQDTDKFSLHDYTNTEQFETFEMWFVKEPRIHFQENRMKDAFYYGTRLIITPIFFAGNEESEWERAYSEFRDTLCTVNARAVLKGKPLRSYIRLTPKRKISNYYIRQRGKFSIKKAEEKYASKHETKFVVYPHLIDRNKRDPNSLPWIVNEKSKLLTSEMFRNIEIVEIGGVECYSVLERERIVNCFPNYIVKEILSKNKSQLALMGNTYLWRIQRIQVDLLKEFDRICRKNQLRYNLSFGTLLGAVRHQGFIPWDDDIDVTMPWEDFNKLDDLMKKELNTEKYYYRCPENEPNNHLIFKHLERKGTIYTKPGREKLEHSIGVFIDIFPMYPAAPLKVLDWGHAKVCRYWRTALWATIGAESEQNPKLKRKYIRMAKNGNIKCYNNFVNTATFFKNKKYLKFWIAMDRNPYKVSLVKMDNYINTIDIEFEGEKFKAPKNYEDVLNYCFGKDWRMYPSVRGRLPAHNANVRIGDLYLLEGEKK